jgi:hypothetical protein
MYVAPHLSSWHLNGKKTVNIRYRQTQWPTCLALVCLATVLLSTTIQTAHFCAFRGANKQAALELDPSSSGSPVCLICLMSPSTSAIILLVAFFIVSRSNAFVGRKANAPQTDPRFFRSVHSPASARLTPKGRF